MYLWLKEFLDDSKKQAKVILIFLWLLFSIFVLFGVVIIVLWGFVNEGQPSKVYPHYDSVAVYGNSEIQIEYPNYVLVGEKSDLVIIEAGKAPARSIKVNIPNGLFLIDSDQKIYQGEATIELPRVDGGKTHLEKLELVAPSPVSLVTIEERLEFEYPSTDPDEKPFLAEILIEGSVGKRVRGFITANEEAAGWSGVAVSVAIPLLGYFINMINERLKTDEALEQKRQDERVSEFRETLDKDPLHALVSFFEQFEESGFSADSGSVINSENYNEDQGFNDRGDMYFNRCMESIKLVNWTQKLPLAAKEALDRGMPGEASKYISYLEKVSQGEGDYQISTLKLLVEALNNEEIEADKVDISTLIDNLDISPLWAQKYVAKAFLKYLNSSKADPKVIYEAYQRKEGQKNFSLYKQVLAVPEVKKKLEDKKNKSRSEKNVQYWNYLLTWADSEGYLHVDLRLFWQHLPIIDQNFNFQSWLVMNGFFFESGPEGNRKKLAYHPFIVNRAEYDGLLDRLPIVKHHVFEDLLDPVSSIVFGKAGVGKTTTAFQLARDCSRKRILPIYVSVQRAVELSHWLLERIIIGFVNILIEFPHLFWESDSKQKVHLLDLIKYDPLTLDLFLTQLEIVGVPSNYAVDFEWVKNYVKLQFSEEKLKLEKIVDVYKIADKLKQVQVAEFEKLYIILDFASDIGFEEDKEFLAKLKECVQVFTSNQIVLKIFAPFEIEEDLRELFPGKLRRQIDWDRESLSELLKARKFDVKKVVRRDISSRAETWLIGNSDTPGELILRGRKLLDIVEEQNKEETYKFSIDDFTECFGEWSPGDGR